MPSAYKQHVAKWSNCQLCDLCNGRKHVVLLRGSVPAPVLLVGEAPGESEDVIGQPFVGPAGRLLDEIIAKAGLVKGQFALTNVVSCIPRDEDNNKVHAPPDWAAKACRNRLVECFELVKPKLIVWVGGEAKKYGPLALKYWPEFPETVDLIHPAAILRMDVSQKGLAYQRAVIALKDAVEETLG